MIFNLTLVNLTYTFNLLKKMLPYLQGDPIPRQVVPHSQFPVVTFTILKEHIEVRLG